MDWITSIKDIKKAQENNQLVIFVGAGVSKNSNVPTWWELIKKLAIELNYDKCDDCKCKNKGKKCPDDKCENRYNFTQEDFLRIPQYFYQKNKEDENVYFDLIQTTLRGGNGPNPIDDEIFDLLPHHIITTNYDNLLESSTAINSQLYSVVSQDSDLLSKSNDRYIIKMHGDLENVDTIVLKENDYIDYEQKHPLISTFIRSLLVNHTFVFLGYSLNDYNLNLIIGWINYFREFHNIKNAPKNYLIDTKEATKLEKERLEDKNIYVIDLNTLPDDVKNDFAIPTGLSDPKGQLLYKYLKCVTSSKHLQKYIPLEEQLIEKYELLNPYYKISYNDLISVFPLGYTEFIETTLVFYEKSWFEKISEIIKNPDSMVTKTFNKTGIFAIRLFENDSYIKVPNSFKKASVVFLDYLNNDYSKLEKDMLLESTSIEKLYYSHFLGKDKKTIESLLKNISNEISASNYVEIILQKSRARAAVLSFFERQEEKTQELQKLFDKTPEKWREATSLLRMLFESAALNMHKMNEILAKVEKRYEYHSNTFYTEHPHLNLLKLQSYAYDYFFFFVENGLPLHYFSNPKEYFSYYLKSILCTYSPTGSDPRSFFQDRTNNPHYVINEIDFDMMVKYTEPKNLNAWLRKYSVQEIELEKEIDIIQKFNNLCKSMAKFKIVHWKNPIMNFTILARLIKTENKISILISLCELLESALDNGTQIVDELFEALEYIIVNYEFDNAYDIYIRIVKLILNPKINSFLHERHQNSVNRVLKYIGNQLNDLEFEYLIKNIENIEIIDEKLKKIYNLRFILPKNYCKSFFNNNFKLLNAEKIFYLLIDNFLNYSEKCWTPFVETISKLAKSREEHPGTMSYPDWLAVTIEHSIVLKLLGFEVDLQVLSPYVKHSKYLEFILDPINYNYSNIDTSDYMWQNFIYSKDYKQYFINNKISLLSDDLKNIFKMGLETVDQSKIVYGILLNESEIQKV